MVGQPLAAQQGRAGEGDIIGVGQGRAHVLRQVLILGPVGLVHQHDDIVPGAEHGELLPLVIPELVDQGEDEGLVGLQKLPQLPPVLRLALLVGPDDAGLHEILVNLVVQILPVRDDEKGEVAGDLLLHLAREKHHGEGFAGALGVPEHAQLALELPAVLHGRHQVVDAEELVVLGDDLVPLVPEHDEILDIVNKVRLVQEAVHEIAHRAFPHGVRRADGLAVGPLLFGIHLQPFKEMVVSGVEGPQPGLEAVTQHAHLVEGEQVGDVLLILGQVLPVGFLHLDDAVFQLHEDHGQAVDEDEHVRPVPVIPALDPHLGHRRKGVVFGALEIHQFHEIEVRLPVPAEFHANAVADLLIVGVVDRDQVRAGEVPKKILFDLRQLLPRYARVQPEQRLV